MRLIVHPGRASTLNGFNEIPPLLDIASQTILLFANVLGKRRPGDLQTCGTWRHFAAFSLFCSRHGQILNKTDLAAPLGVTVPTIGDWLRILEIAGQVILVPPYVENFGRRLVESPKVHLGDSDLACYLLGLTSSAELERSPFLGPLFEGFVAAEILKSQADSGMRSKSVISVISRVWRWTSSYRGPRQTVAGRNSSRKDCSAFHSVAANLSTASLPKAIREANPGPSKVSLRSVDDGNRLGGGGPRC
jgi:hypothetical protein